MNMNIHFHFKLKLKIGGGGGAISFGRLELGGNLPTKSYITKENLSGPEFSKIFRQR